MKTRTCVRTWLLLVVIALGVLGLTLPIQAVEYQASTTVYVGDSALYPRADFAKIQDAVVSVQYGTRIVVYPGIYTENVVINESIILVSSQGAAATTIKAADTNKHVVEINHANVKVEGFTLTGATGDKKGGIALREGANRCIIKNNVMTGNYAGMGLNKCYSNIITCNTFSNNSYGMGLTESSGGCAVEQSVAIAYGDSRPAASENAVSWINDYRQLRDNSLSNSFISSYYEVSPEVNKVLLLHPTLAVRACGILQKYAPAAARAASPASGEDCTITNDNLDEVTTFARDLSQALQGDYPFRQSDQAARAINLMNQFIEQCQNVKPGQSFSVALHNSCYFQAGEPTASDQRLQPAGFEDLGSTNYIYLNNFYTNKTDSVYADKLSNFQSPYELVYQFGDQTYCSYLGNYYSDYQGIDGNNDGIGDTSYRMKGDQGCTDQYPLISYYEQYNVAEVTIQPSTVSGRTPLKVQFTASVPAQMGVWYYEWDFDGDGHIDQTTSESTTEYSYTQPGKYLPYVAVVRPDWKTISSEPVEIYVVDADYVQGAVSFQPLYPNADSEASQVMRGGRAHRYYTLLNSNSQPVANGNFYYYFHEDGNMFITTTDASGVVDIMTPVMYQDQHLTLCMLDANQQEKLDVTGLPSFDVKVDPRKLSQEWSILFGLSATGGVGAPSAKFGPAEFKTAELGLEGGRQTCTKLKYDTTGDSTDVTILNQQNLSMGYKGSLGVSASVWKKSNKNAPSIGVGAETSGQVNGRIGAGGTLPDFMNEADPYHNDKLMSAGVLLLESGVKSMPTMPAGMDGIINFLTNRLNPYYCNLLSQDFGAKVETGVGLKFNIGSDDESKTIELPRWDGKLVTSVGTVLDTAAKKVTRTGHVEMENGFSWSIPDIPKPIQDTSVTFGAGNQTMEIESENGKDTLSLTTAQPTSIGLLAVSQTVETACKVEVSDPASLEELKKKRTDNQKLLTAFYPDFWPHQFDNMLEDAQQLSVPSSYSIEQSKETAIDIPFDIELALGIKLGLGLQLTGKESISTDMESGVIKQSVHRATATYEEDPELLNHKQSLASFVKTITKPVADAITGFLNQAKKKVNEGVQLGKAVLWGDWGTAQGIIYQVDSRHQSYRIMALPADYRHQQLSAAEMAYDASTVGDVYIVGMTDEASGQEITDFSDNPLELSLSYDLQMLEAAGLPAGAEEHLAIYRLEGSVGYYIYQPGQLDKEQKKVTTLITKPGQYILAVDSNGPQISQFMVSNNTALPKITAVITDDFSGIKTDSLEFYLDEVRIDNPAQYYDPVGNLFSYQVAIPLDSGSHTSCLTVSDSAGNASSTAHLQFTVNDSLPSINILPPIAGPINQPILIQALATDDTEIKTVSLYYKAVGSSGSYHIVDMPLVNTFYETEIPAEEVTGTIQYLIKVEDMDGNIVSTDVATIEVQDTLLPAITGNSVDSHGRVQSSTAPITVSFNKPVLPGSDFSSIECQGGPMFFHLKDQVLSITPANPLVPNQVYTINIPAAAVQDRSSQSLASDYSFTFRLPGDVDQWDTVYNQPPDKEWKIRFNQPVDMSIFTGGEIAVFDANQDQVTTIIVPSENDYVLTVISTENYQYGQCYSLYIGGQIRSHSGALLSKPVRMDFVITVPGT